MTTPTTVVDTSFLVSSFLPTDRNHAAAVSWLDENFAERELMTPSLARCEFASALARNGVSAASIDQALAALGRRFTIVDTSESLLQLATEVARDHRVRGCDSVFVALAARQRARLVTFDADQAQKGRALIGVDLLGGEPAKPTARTERKEKE